MNRMLLLTYHFPPSAASGTFRMLGFARHLPTFGWRAGVVGVQAGPGRGAVRRGPHLRAAAHVAPARGEAQAAIRPALDRRLPRPLDQLGLAAASASGG